MSVGLLIPPTGLRDDVNATVKQEVRQIMVDILHDPVGHAEAVAAGPVNWREVFVKYLGGFFGHDKGRADELADLVYRFVAQQWRARYPGLSAGAYLDTVYVASPLSEKEIEREIDDAWVVEIGSDERSMQTN